MKLGPLQKEWVDTLRKYPERQITSRLGFKDIEGNLHLCCLGQACLIAGHGKFNPRNLQGEEVLSDEGDEGNFCNYDSLGLIYVNGPLVNSLIYKNHKFWSLAGMNDAKISWTEIANYIEENPNNVFTKSV